MCKLVHQLLVHQVHQLDGVQVGDQVHLLSVNPCTCVSPANVYTHPSPHMLSVCDAVLQTDGSSVQSLELDAGGLSYLWLRRYQVRECGHGGARKNVEGVCNKKVEGFCESGAWLACSLMHSLHAWARTHMCTLCLRLSVCLCVWQAEFKQRVASAHG